MPGEFELIDWIRAQQRASDLVQVPAGDDLAVLKWKPDDLLLVGVDQVLDGVHFDSNIHSPRAIGRKAMNRNLSDCAAMACLPAAALVSVALPRDRDIEYAKELYLGIKKAASEFKCAIVGGETGTWDARLAVTVTILGRSDGIEPVRRSGAKRGEFIYVTGELGGSLLGRHMTFQPRVREARQIAAEHRPGAMIDLSDGLSRDLHHLCAESRVGAVLDAGAIPIHDDAIRMRRDGRSPLDHALHDGEDYELLFTAPRPGAGVRCHAIGVIVAERGVWLEKDGKREPLKPQGWEHRF
jgi:thiamine-monophosphate kinase